MRKYDTMPRKGLNTESKINACNGSFGLPFGAGIRSTIALSMASTPIPVLPLAGKMSSWLQPISSHIWSDTSSGMALLRSILFNTGIISKSLSNAKYRFDMVWACMP